MAGHVIIFDLHVPLPPLLFIPHVQKLLSSCTVIWSQSSVLLECQKKKKRAVVGNFEHFFFIPFPPLLSLYPSSCSTAYQGYEYYDDTMNAFLFSTFIYYSYQ